MLFCTLSKISHPIGAVVRTDSSGTSQIFTQALSLFDPLSTLPIPLPHDYSFANTVGNSSNPHWCGLLTDEIQIFTIKGCTSLLPNKMIHMKVINGNYSVRNVAFPCDASVYNITSAFLDPTCGPGLALIISKRITLSGNTEFRIGM